MSWREFIKMKSIIKKHLVDLPNSSYVVNENVEVPPLTKFSVLIQVKACALSNIDDKVLKLLYRNTHRNNDTSFPVGLDVAGIVKEVGSAVTSFRPGDEVVGIIPLDYNISGCAEFVVLHEFDLTRKPEEVSFVDAAGCIGDAVKAYTALHYLGRITSGDTVLILDGASAFGSLCIQLAYHWGAKVITTVSSEDERLYVDALDGQLARVIDLSKHKSHSFRFTEQYVWSSCMDETGGLGVDLIIEGGPLYKDPNDNRPYSMPTPHEIISSLAVGGRWITSNHDLQLDPPNSRLLFLKCASVGFLFEQAWTLSSTHQGRYLHILMDIMEKVAHGIIRPNIHHTVTFDSVVEVMSKLQEIRVGKVVMKVD